MFNPKDPKWTAKHETNFSLTELAAISILLGEEVNRSKDPTMHQLFLSVQKETRKHTSLPEFKRLISYILGTDKNGLEA